MATVLPPPPITDSPGSFTWLEWYRQLRNYITQNGNVPWSILDFNGSNLADLQQRSHQVLQQLQGGQPTQYYHLTQSEHDRAVRASNVVTTTLANGFSYTIPDNTGVLYATISGSVTSGTFILPVNPLNRQELCVSVSAAASGITWNAGTGKSIIYTPAALSVGNAVRWAYNTATTTWYPK